MDELRDAAAIGVEDLKVAEPQRPPSPEATLALDCRRGLLGGARRSPVLRLESHRLVVEYPSLLTEPLVVDPDRRCVAERLVHEERIGPPGKECSRRPRTSSKWPRRARKTRIYDWPTGQRPSGARAGLSP